jgi:hypothetical protein
MWWLNNDILFSAEKCGCSVERFGDSLGGGSIRMFCSQQRDVMGQEMW